MLCGVYVTRELTRKKCAGTDTSINRVWAEPP